MAGRKRTRPRTGLAIGVSRKDVESGRVSESMRNLLKAGTVVTPDDPLYPMLCAAVEATDGKRRTK